MCRQSWCGTSSQVAGCRFRVEAVRPRRWNIDQNDAQGEFNDNTKNDLASLRLDSTLRIDWAVAHDGVVSNSTSTFGVNAQFDNRNQRSNASDDTAKTG